MCSTFGEYPRALHEGILLIIIPLAIFAALVATFLVPCFLAEYQFGLRSPWPLLVGAGSLCATLFALYRWMLHLQRKERTVLATSHHPVFGEVQRLKDHWEASTPIADGGSPIEIWGEALEPVPAQVSTFAAICERYPELLQRTVEAAGDFFQSLNISISHQDLQLDSIYLASDAFGSFDFTFSAPAHEQKLPWGLSATFHDFSVDEISDNH